MNPHARPTHRLRRDYARGATGGFSSLYTVVLLGFASVAPLPLSACSVYDPGLVNEPSFAGRAALEAGASPECGDAQSTCQRPHAATACAEGACTIASCEAPYVDCDERADNGCEADLTSAEHCGLCQAACRFSHAAASCNAGRCTLGACEPDYADCDGDPGNGCERAVNTIRDCGACDRACDRPPHTSAVCNGGVCGTRCDEGYGDCNALPADGCELRLIDIEHCGDCQTKCLVDHVHGAECSGGECVITGCMPGFHDCNGDSSDGCEADLSSADSCGGCGEVCGLPQVASVRCERTAESSACAIDRSCTEPGCNPEVQARGCASDFADCDELAANGCETDLRGFASCGTCTHSCAAPHKLTVCEQGRCVTQGCSDGYAQCEGDADCRSVQGDPQHCGACGHACEGSAPHCAGGKCTAQTCEAGRADCDGAASNGCETALDDTQHCGGCEVRCAPLPHAEVACSSGSCVIARCARGFADCDADPKNGCEVDLNSPEHCGACGARCVRAHAQARCEAGSCRLLECDEGRADCDGDPSNGCEADLRSPAHCGSCENACTTRAHAASASCGPSGCRLRCATGFGDCDGQAANGCEADLNAGASCGRCGNDCTQLPNVKGAGCSEGSCQALVCDTGFGDCNGTAADGCERKLNTAADCGACDRPCAPAHAEPDCGQGSCGHADCDTGFGDCDGNPSNGCETALTSPEHCGGCGVACSPGAPCMNGQCGCARDDECASGSRCCDHRCVNTQGECFPFPCIPGTALRDNRNNCGACGAICLGFCCGPLL